jgi:hypothetical protein
MKVYVIEKGIYSDRHIIGVVESEEEAKNIVEAIKCGDYKDDSISYEEYDTRQFSDKRLRYTVSRYSHGDWQAEYDDYDLYKEFKENACVYSDYYVIYANSPNQAIKIAQDMRAEELAHKNGLTE